MEMSLNTVSFASLPWSLWLLFFLVSVTQTTSSAPTSKPPLTVNTTLLFDSGAPSHNLRNCSCSSTIQDCNETLANRLCRCHTVLRSALPPAGLREPERLTVWIKEHWVLQELLNRSTVAHLQLSFCGMKPIDSEYLALLGLRTLRIHSAAAGAPYPYQEITVYPAAGVAVELEPPSFHVSSSFRVTLLDVSVFSGLSALKAYTVVGPPAQALPQHFPCLLWPLVLPSSSPDEPPDSSENLLITFVY